MNYLNMDKRFKISKTLIPQLMLILIFATIFVYGAQAFGYDSANACSPNGKTSRRGRAQLIKAIPCDFSEQAFCNLPGSAYPWHAVRRFVHENQGLMKRMYGDVRHIAILRDEIQNNEIEMEDVEIAAARYSKDGVRRSSKFMHVRDDYGGIKSNDVLKEPHFRPVTTTTTTTKPTTSTSNETKLDDSAAKQNNNFVRETTLKLSNKLKENINSIVSAESDEISMEDDLDTNDDDDDNLESNSVYGAPTLSANGDNIQMVEPPKFGIGLNNLTQPATISTTLKKITNSHRASVNHEQLKKPQNIRQHPVQTQYQQQLHKKQQQQQQQQQHLPTNKVDLTISKESSNLKIKLNESERLPILNSNSSTTPTTATTTTTATLSASTASSASSAKPHLSQPASVKGAGVSTTTHLKSNANKSANNNSENAHSAHFETTTTKTILPTSSASASSSSTPTSTSTLITTSTSLPSSSSTATSSALPSPLSLSTSSLISSMRPNIDLLSGEKLQKPFGSTTTSTPASPVTMASTKPVLRDGQLFQDTIKQETPPILNARGVNACPVKEEVVAPFWANNTRGEVLALLNLYPFEQYVHWEKCLHEHKQMYCRDGCRCEQQYRLHRLLAYDPHNECRGIFSDWFRFPSSCICKCYDIPMDFRATSRSPRSERLFHDDDDDGEDDADANSNVAYTHPIEQAEQEVKKAIYEHATEDWYRPKDDSDVNADI